MTITQPVSQVSAVPIRSLSPSSANGGERAAQMQRIASPPIARPGSSQPRAASIISISPSAQRNILPPKPRPSSKPWPSALVPASSSGTNSSIPASSAALPRGPISSLIYGAVASKPTRPVATAPGILGGRPVGMILPDSASVVAYGAYQSFLKGKEKCISAVDSWGSPQAPVSPLLNKNIMKDFELLKPVHSPFSPADGVEDMAVDRPQSDPKKAKRKKGESESENAKKGKVASPAEEKSPKPQGPDSMTASVGEGALDSGTAISSTQ